MNADFAAFATCECPAGKPSGQALSWIGMQDALMAPSCTAFLLLSQRYPNTGDGCSPTAEGSTFLPPPQPRKAAKEPCLPQLTWAFNTSTWTGEYEDGGEREEKA